MSNYQLSIKNYPFYKDSGVEWLGDVPEHWKERRVKDIATLERGKFTHRPRNDPQMYDGLHPFIQTGDVARAIKYITVYKQTLSDKGTSVSKQFKKGTLVMAIAANIGDVAIVDFDTYFPDSIVAYKPKNNDTDYLFYLFSATQHDLDKVKVTSTQDNLNLERLNSLIRFIPPLAEQKSIAHYLDTKTAQIDRKIDLLTQKATQYGNLKQSLINETVIRGLDKSVPMKDSAIEWIGEVPEHWEIKRLKDIGTSIIGITYAPEDALGDETNGLLVLRSSNIQNGQLSLSDTVYVNKKVNPKQLVRKGDILICSRNGSRALIGKNICIDEIMEGQTFGAFMTVYRSKYFRFISKFFNSNIFVSQSGLFGSSTINQLTINTLNNFLLIFPPLSEQKAIADYLDTKTTQIDQIIQTINTQIEKLKELRKTLINDVVTGKIRTRI